MNLEEGLVLLSQRCDTCDNTHEYVVKQDFLDNLSDGLKVVCATCGKIRKQVPNAE